MEERKCQLCDSGGVEDEMHFLFNCSKYKNERIEFFNSINMNDDNLTDEDRLQLCFNNPHTLGKYIRRIYDYRKACLFKES